MMYLYYNSVFLLLLFIVFLCLSVYVCVLLLPTWRNKDRYNVHAYFNWIMVNYESLALHAIALTTLQLY